MAYNVRQGQFFFMQVLLSVVVLYEGTSDSIRRRDVRLD